MGPPEIEEMPRIIQVEFSDTLVKRLEEWSEPVHIKVARTADGKHVLLARTIKEMKAILTSLDEASD